MKNAFIVGGDRFNETTVLLAHGYDTVGTMEEADIVVFTGGADINPALYGELPHPSVGFIDSRDKSEIVGYEKAKALGKGMLGICRGAQLLNVMVGGTLYQDVNNHQGTHAITTDDGRVFDTTSVHHQMMRVADGAVIKAWATNQATRRTFMDGKEPVSDQGGIDPEIVVYPEHRMVLVQGHPEFGQHSPLLQEFRDYVFELVNRL